MLMRKSLLFQGNKGDETMINLTFFGLVATPSEHIPLY